MPLSRLKHYCIGFGRCFAVRPRRRINCAANAAIPAAHTISVYHFTRNMGAMQVKKTAFLTKPP
jgi:hypothetical protein